MIPYFHHSIPFQHWIKDAALQDLSQYPWMVFLDSCEVEKDEYSRFEWIAAAGNPESCQSWESLSELKKAPPGWKFGAFSYEFKNELNPDLPTPKPASIPFPALFYFEPEIVIAREKGSDEICIFGEWVPEKKIERFLSVQAGIQAQVEQEAYLERMARIKNFIREGDFYELNYCREFFGEISVNHPELLWKKLIEISPTPFAACLRKENTWALCASPERFLQKTGSRIVTQPIKGTLKRSGDVTKVDEEKNQLFTSQKDRAENVMITDLSRNDLNRVCMAGTVKVPKLFEVQTLKGLYHLVSTVEGVLPENSDPFLGIECCFPPGSMTGAPKIRVMERIEELEKSGRGLFSGSIGYIDPAWNFDLNVVIRTLMLETEKGEFSFHSGGAITWQSEANEEFEETHTKISPLLQALGKRPT